MLTQLTYFTMLCACLSLTLSVSVADAIEFNVNSTFQRTIIVPDEHCLWFWKVHQVKIDRIGSCVEADWIPSEMMLKTLNAAFNNANNGTRATWIAFDFHFFISHFQRIESNFLLILIDFDRKFTHIESSSSLSSITPLPLSQFWIASSTSNNSIVQNSLFRWPVKF